MFKKSRYLDLEFEGNRRILSTCVIFALEAKRLLHKGCEAYLAYVVDKSTLEVAMDIMPVVQEFPNVFSKDLRSLPPDRELEFGIELLPSSSHVSILPCKIALAELKELKTQFQDLVDKGFI